MARPAIPIKLVVVGDGGVGKSSITTSLLRREFTDEWDPTIEDSYSTMLTIDGQDYAVEIVDTAGQEEYRGMWGEQTVREGDGFILVYAIDSQTSFDLLPMFLHTIRKVKSPDENPSPIASPENTPFPFTILANKCDKHASRVVTAQTGLLYARSAGGLFTECSAKLRVNIDAGFESIVRATARSKAAHQEYLRAHGGVDDEFNGNVVVLERERMMGPTRRKGVGGWEEDETEVVGAQGQAQGLAQAKRKISGLGMDRRASYSVGGMGRHPDKLDGKGGCCGCVVA